MAPLTPLERCISSLGVYPRPVIAGLEEFFQPAANAVKAVKDRAWDLKFLAQGQKIVPARVRDAFFLFDGDGNGHVDYEELRLALNALGFDVNFEQSNLILQHYDTDNNGTLELDEFDHLVAAFEKVSIKKIEEAKLSGTSSVSGMASAARLTRMRDESSAVAPEVRRLSVFLEQGITGLTPRADQTLEMHRGADRDADTEELVIWLKSLGVTMGK